MTIYYITQQKYQEAISLASLLLDSPLAAFYHASIFAELESGSLFARGKK